MVRRRRRIPSSGRSDAVSPSSVERTDQEAWKVAVGLAEARFGSEWDRSEQKELVGRCRRQVDLLSAARAESFPSFRGHLSTSDRPSGTYSRPALAGGQRSQVRRAAFP